MAFTGNFMCTSFKQELLEAEHDFNNGAHTFRMALYTDSASFNAATTAYTTGNEISGTGYTANSHASDASVLILDFGTLKTATAGTFTVAFPVADASNAIIRIA